MREMLLSAAAAASVSIALTGSASAALLLHEPFDYAPGGLLGQTNASTGNNWLQAGTQASPSAINVVGGSLAAPAPLVPAAGNALAVTGVGNGSGSTGRLALPATISSGTVYYSMLLRVDQVEGAGSNTTTGGFFFALNNTGNSSQTTTPSAAAAKLQMRQDATDPAQYNLGIFPNVSATAAASSWSGPMSVGVTHLIVVSHEIVPGTVNDISRMWIDPDPLTFGAGSEPPADITAATGGTDINIASILVRQSPAPFLTMDEVRVGTTWADVTPVPEPATASIVGLSGLALLARRRRVQAR